MDLESDQAPEFDQRPDYNDWLDEQYLELSDELNVFGFKPRPSFVLYKLSIDTYEAAYADYQTQNEDQLKEIVIAEFPAPIAHFFYRFLHGSENDLQRLHFLRDTWEAIINLLHALVLGETRSIGLSLNEPITFSDCLSERMHARLLNIERILDQAETKGSVLESAKIVSRTLLTKMRELNQTRNAFSHVGAQSEEQARQFISEAYPDVLTILAQLEELREIKLMRYLSQSGLTRLRHERFDGYAITKTIKELELTAAQIGDAARYLKDDQVLVNCRGRCFGMRPFYYFQQDPNGHVTKLCFFKHTASEGDNRVLVFEVVGESREVTFDRSVFKPELDEIRAMFGLGPD